MERSWMLALRTSKEYQMGVEGFIEFAKRNVASKDGKYFCPCVKCVNAKRKSVEDIRDDLICDGINLRYKKWLCHGELGSSAQSCTSQNIEAVGDDVYDDGMDDMINDIGAGSFSTVNEFDELRSDADKPLFPGCKKYTRLTGILKLVQIKTECGWADAGFTKMLTALSDMFPDGNVLPKRMYEAKKVLSTLFMDCEKIHACPNDCVLYRNEYESLEKCPKCNTPRYKSKNDAESDDDSLEKGSPLKAMWYLPIIPRFRRLFANPKEAENLRWHCDERISDKRYLRHPTDSPQWKKIDSMFPEFGGEPRNLRLGLCTDGFNPFGSLNISRSSWPVLLIIYNLPPWLCTKRKYVMMSMMISGPKQPGNDIDVYLAPLIDDLKMLWQEGIDVFDAQKKETFKLRAMLFSTINDFPAYGNLSGYSVKGHFACPICQSGTHFQQLKHGRKTVYLGHRRFLDRFHPYRKLKKCFNGSSEFRSAPSPLTGEEVYHRVKNVNVEFGKKKKTKIGSEKNIWKKRSIFFDLPYWRFLDVRHNIDVMHVEKNVGESLIGTLLHIQGKTKDGLNARLDLVKLGIRQRLHPIISENNKRAYMEPAAHTLSKQEKISFCECLRGIKVPRGYPSNVSRLVSMDDLKLVGMKSHDYLVLMQQLLPVAIRGIMRDDVRMTITRLCRFFNAICSKVIDTEKLDELEKEGYIILTQLEMHFAPAFFDIMVHLIVHLVREIRLCGPVYLRWMYPFEQFMKVLKGYSKNLYRPEASIVERYLLEEAMDFGNLYLKRVDEESPRHEDETGNGVRGCSVKTMSREVIMQAHLYILNNMKEVQPYLNEHKRILKEKNPKKSDMHISNEHNKTFIEWFKEHVGEKTVESDTIRKLARKPRLEVVTWAAYDVNGFSFYTNAWDNKSTMQNSGVMVVAEAMHFSSAKDKNLRLASMAYYGVIEEIWEVIYTNFKVPSFKCKWVNNSAVVIDPHTGMISVDLHKVGYGDDPFILASHAKQVFYVTDPANKQLSIVLESKKQKDRAPTLSSDEISPLTSSPPKPSNELELIDDDQFAFRNDHCEGIWDNA